MNEYRIVQKTRLDGFDFRPAIQSFQEFQSGLGVMVSETIHFDSFGAYLKHHRMAAKVSRRELAEALGISANRVTDMERGKAPMRSGKMLAIIKQVVPSVCEVSLCQLYMQDLVDRLVERHDLAGLVCDIVVE